MKIKGVKKYSILVRFFNKIRNNPRSTHIEIDAVPANNKFTGCQYIFKISKTWLSKSMRIDLVKLRITQQLFGKLLIYQEKEIVVGKGI